MKNFHIKEKGRRKIVPWSLDYWGLGVFGGLLFWKEPKKPFFFKLLRITTETRAL